MKAINKILCSAGLAVVALGVSSCDLTQPTPSAFDETVVFSNPSLAEYNIFGIYQCLGETNCHRGRYLPWYGFNTDIECYQSNTYDGNNLDWAAYDCSPTNKNMNLDNGPYTKIMEGLERANICVKYLRQYGTSEEMKPLLGEALVARAFLYTELIKGYGEVPFRFEPVTTETAYANKADRDDLYVQLLSDLREAIVLLDGVNPARTDRVGQVFAQGLFARLAFMASGSSLRPEPGTTGTGNAGIIGFSSRPELQKEVLYPEVLKYLEDAISSNHNKLYSDYEQLWRDFNNFDLEGGKEVIFSIPFSDSRGRWNYTFAIRAEKGTIVPWANFQGNARGGSVGPTPQLYYKYGKNDQRRDVSCVNWRWENDPGQRIPAGQMNWYFGKFRFEWMTASPYTGGNDDGIKPVYMRYSDILLMAAEAANELGELDKAKAYFMQVRNRAYKGHESEAAQGLDLTSKAGMFQAIKDERALEFVGEMLRKQDLIRWGELSKNIKAAQTEIASFARLEGDYSGHGPALWYGYDDKGEIYMYGLEKGELCDEATDPAYIISQISEKYGVTLSEVVLESKEYFKENDSSNKRIASMYKEGFDPDLNMWWPIPATVITTSQGSLVNDYGY